MPFDWEDFLELSNILKDGDEAARRTAVSRAYYAAFGSVCCYAEVKLGFRPKESGEDHGRIRNCLNEAGEFKQANNLQTLRKYRGCCDYDKDTIVETRMDQYVNVSLDLAAKVIKHFSTP